MKNQVSLEKSNVEYVEIIKVKKLNKIFNTFFI